MKKIRNVLIYVISLVLAVSLTVVGTIAYLQDEKGSVNVMTVGSVHIELLEYQRAEGVPHDAGDMGKGNGVKKGALVPYVQNQPIYPAVPADENDSTCYSAEQETDKLFFWGDYVYSGTAGNGLWNDDKLDNVMDKMVFVKNTGKSDAYTRTLIAFECPEGMEYSLGADKEFMMNTNGSAVYEWSTIGYIEVEGVRYLVTEALYVNALNPGNTSHPSLLQVVMTHNATNEHMELIGDSYEILVIAQATQTTGFADAKTALDRSFGVTTLENAAKWFGGVLAEFYTDTWDGKTADTSWYNDTDSEFTLSTAEQFAGLAELVDGGNNFAGKTIKLDKNLDLYAEDENGDPICFDPIGSYRNDKIFEGTFDGQGHAIENMTQNTWALDNGYYYGDLGLGLFGAVENATIKNLVMDNANISGESALCGTIAAVAGENVTFENIKVTNSNVADYQYYAGGIVGWAGGDEQFIGCVIDASTTIGAQWGEFNNANGGVIGGASTDADIFMKDCTVACRIDAFNDVTSAYEWYSYRRSGMLIGDSGQVDDPDGDNVGNAIAPNLTCENVTVIYGEWANYHYCKFSAMRYPWVRAESGISTGTYSNPRYGHPTDANGNEVVDENHTHNDGEAHLELIVFDQLYGGKTGDRYCTYGTATHDGVTVIYNNK